jgi:hypothetical protein
MASRSETRKREEREAALYKLERRLQWERHKRPRRRDADLSQEYRP